MTTEIVDETYFNFMVCKCSLRTAEEEARLGSYCFPCWNSVKKYKKCVICDLDITKERLYVDAIFQVPTCKKCYLSKYFKLELLLKGFVPVTRG
jgi:hypothetical protein